MALIVALEVDRERRIFASARRLQRTLLCAARFDGRVQVKRLVNTVRATNFAHLLRRDVFRRLFYSFVVFSAGIRLTRGQNHKA